MYTKLLLTQINPDQSDLINYRSQYCAIVWSTASANLFLKLMSRETPVILISGAEKSGNHCLPKFFKSMNEKY